LKETIKYIVDLIAEGPSMVITHGNGPPLQRPTCFIISQPFSSAINRDFPMPASPITLTTPPLPATSMHFFT
jgi:hypothetical protein